ncbi:organic cation transporter protein-like [Dendronephthya gigantea]|uniref:organic cation transporter protein-like n=1 Tax=Dendronephthya gigantea TaxID=151771 RepID=UPI00106C1BEE|nr:organic cation transporter protein-like [Dendronephthya gigantea]
MADRITVDEALAKLGGFGLFQWLIYLGASIAEMAVTYQIFLLTFIAAEPKWVCKNESIICNFTKSIGLNDDDYEARCDMPRSEWKFADDFTSIVTEFDLVCDDSILATVASMFIFAGWIIGSVLFGFLSDRFGRKVAFLSCVINISVVALIGAFVNALWQFIIIRFFVGVGIGCSASLFIILSEFSGVKHRGTMGVIFWFSFIFGLCILPLYAHLIRDWRKLTILTSCLGFPAFIVWWIFPESVRYYLIKGKEDEAHEVLERVAKYNRKPIIKDKLEQVEEEQKSSLKDLFATPTIRKYTLLSCFIWCVESIVYYGVSFASVLLGGNIYLSFFIINSMEIPATILAIWTVERFGRKKTTLWGMVVACVASILGVVFRMHQDNLYDGYWIMTVIMAMLSKGFINLSFTGVWVWSNELFPTVVRNTGMGTTNGLARVGSFLSGYVIWLTRIHPLIPYSIFATMAFFASCACLLLPETTGRPTQEVISEGQVPAQEIKLSNTDKSSPTLYKNKMSV